MCRKILDDKTETNSHLFKAHDFYKAGNYSRALYHYQEAAKLKSPEGLFHLALMYEKGLAVERNFKKCIDLMKEAAEYPPKRIWNGIEIENTGVCDSEYSLGCAYHQGLYVPKNISQAIYWYDRAVRNDNKNACNNLAEIYIRGEDVPQDMKKAEKLLLLGYKLGLLEAASNLTQLYLCIKDEKRALIWHQRALNKGCPTSIRKNQFIMQTISQIKQYNTSLEPHEQKRQDTLKKFEIFQNLKSIKQSCSTLLKEEQIECTQKKLQKCVKKGSVYAERMLKAKKLFDEALYSLGNDQNLDEKEIH